MNTFTSIKELLSTLVREHKLLTEMFEKRKTLSYKYDLALEMVDYNEERIQYLISHSVINQNGSFLEIEEQFKDFFEQVLEVNKNLYIYRKREFGKNIDTKSENKKTYF